MGVFYPDPLVLRLGDLLVNLIGKVTRLVLHHMSEVNLVAKDGLDCGWRPKITVLADVGFALSHVVEGCRRRHILSIQRCGDFAVTVPLTVQIEDTNYYGGGYRADNQNVLILRVFQIAANARQNWREICLTHLT